MRRRSCVLLLLCAIIYTVSGAGNDKKSVSVCDNGASTGCVEHTIDAADVKDGGGALAASLSSLVEVKRHGHKDVVAERVFNQFGQEIGAWEDISDGDKLYLVAPELQFMYPYNEDRFQIELPDSVLKSPLPGKKVILESMSDSPRVFLIHNLFTETEATAVINNALSLTDPSNRLSRSTIGSGEESEDTERGGGRSDRTRTSDNAWDSTSAAAVRIMKRAFDLVRIPYNKSYADGLQVVRYQPKQGYWTHPDYFGAGDDKSFNFIPAEGGSNRYATVFLYLSDVEEGGQTVFPHAARPHWDPPTEPPEGALDLFDDRTSWEYRMTKMCYQQLAVKPKVTTAALFYSMTSDGRPDKMSEHGACPVTKGMKWGSNLWIWNKPRYGTAGEADLSEGIKIDLGIVNKKRQTVYIKWRNKLTAVLAPGKSINIGTYDHHKFTAHLGKEDAPMFEEWEVGKLAKPLWMVGDARNSFHGQVAPAPLVGDGGQDEEDDGECGEHGCERDEL